jgi:hypothetical protein
MAASVDIDALVARGLDRYRAGDIDGALAMWERALAAAPDDPRALGYVDYVRQNYDELSGGSGSPMSEQLIPFGLSRGDDDEYEISITGGDAPEDTTGTHRVSPGMPERMPEPAIDDGWGIDADSDPTWFAGEHRQITGLQSTMFEDDRTGDRTIERGAHQVGGKAAPHLHPRAGSDDDFGAESESDFTSEKTTERASVKGPSALSPEVQRGLGIAPGMPVDPRHTLPLPPPRPPAPPTKPPTNPAHPRAGSQDLTSDGWPRAPDLELAEPAGPPPVEPIAIDPLSDPRTATADLASLLDPRTATVDMAFDPDLGSMDLGGPGAPVVEALPPPPPREFEERGTADLKVKRGGTNPGRLPTAEEEAKEESRGQVDVEDLLLPPPPSASNAVDDDRDDRLLPKPRALTADEEVTERLSQAIDADAPLLENHDDRAKRRIIALLARASSAATSGDHATAVAAIDLALSEAPDVAAAQKLVHRSRDLILDCYYRFFGDLAAMPVLAAPLAELTRRPLDPRAAFLLSRIDGTLTYEEILDVAGMGRLEACRHLAHLLWRGIIRTPP